MTTGLEREERKSTDVSFLNFLAQGVAQSMEQMHLQHNPAGEQYYNPAAQAAPQHFGPVPIMSSPMMSQPSAGHNQAMTSASYAPAPNMAAAPRPTGAPSTHGAYQPNTVAGSIRKLDPRTWPNPSNVHPFNRHKVTYNTSTFGNPPAAYSKYFVADYGSCSPRFMRSTMYQLPASSSLVNQSHIPMALVVQPLADVGVDEEEVPVVDAGLAGPIRCRRCSAYINPYVKFIDGGRSYECPFCSTQNKVPDEYFSPIEANGFRRDIQERLELWHGSVDYVAPAEYITRTQSPPPLILFVIDVTPNATSTGLLRAFINSVKQILESQFAEDSNVQFGFITFNKTVQFWRLAPKLSLYMLPSVDHVFTPLPASCFIANYATQKHLIDLFFAEVLSCHLDAPTSGAAPAATPGRASAPLQESCLGTAVNAAMLSIGQKHGGRIVVLQSALPTFGPGALKMREDVTHYGKEGEKAFYQPQGKFYTTLAAECSKRFIQVDLFACGSGYSDLATLSELPRITGGHLSYMPGFSIDTHEEKLYYDLFRLMTRAHGSEAIGRLRTSEGLVVDSYHGHFLPGDGDVEFAGVDADQTIAIFLKHDGNLDGRKDAFVQFAMVHTNELGQRLIRVHTLALHVTDVISTIFKSSDLCAVFDVLLRRSLSHLGKDSVSDIRTELTSKVSSILAAYRKHCTKSDRSDAKLILPEALKLLPVHVLGALKSIMLSNPQSVGDVPSIADARVFYQHLVSTSSLDALIPLFYPRIYALHKLHRHLQDHASKKRGQGDGENDSSSEEDENGKADSDEVPLPGDEDHYGSFWLPGLVRASASELEQGGVYLMDDGISITLAFHPPIDTNISQLLLNEHGQLTYNEDDELNRRVWNILQAIRYRRPSYQPVLLVDTQQNTPPRRSFYSRFVEDGSDEYLNSDHIKTLYKLGYSGYLCHLHGTVQDKI